MDPLDGSKDSVRNFVLLSRSISLELEVKLVVEFEFAVDVEFDLECGFEFGNEKFTLRSRVEKLAETALGTAGQSVSCVSSVIGWNFA